MKLRKFVSSLIAASVIATSASSICAMATSPQVYADVERHSDGTYWVNVEFENMPDNLHSGGFHVDLGSGWEIVMVGNEPYAIRIAENVSMEFATQENDDNTESLFIAMAIRDPYAVEGTLMTFQVAKTSNYSNTNAKVNINFDVPGNGLWTFDGTEKESILGSVETPVMLKANEYIIGDADGDGIVDASDSSAISAGIADHPIYSVYNIRKTYNRYFPGAKASAAPDANQNGYINSTDASLVLSYYTKMATGADYDGVIGTIDVYEIFE